MALSRNEPKDTTSERLNLRSGKLARTAADTDEDCAAREPDEIFEAISAVAHEDDGITGSD